MNLGVAHTRPRIGHILAVFGLFMSMCTVLLQATNPGVSRAFGISEIAQLSNNYRADAGLSALILSDTLLRSAQAKTDDMVSRGYFAHNSPDGSTPWSFFDAAGYEYTAAGENLALTNQGAGDVVKGWYDSVEHRVNMLSRDYTEVGYGIAFAPSFNYKGVDYADVYLVAAHYAKPADSAAPATSFSVSPTPTNTTAQAASAPTTASSPKSLSSTDNSSDIPKKAQASSAASGATTSSTSTPGLANIKDTHLVLYKKLGIIGIALGGFFVLLGVLIELRRLLHHQPLVPHLKP